MFGPITLARFNLLWTPQVTEVKQKRFTCRACPSCCDCCGPGPDYNTATWYQKVTPILQHAAVLAESTIRPRVSSGPAAISF